MRITDDNFNDKLMEKANNDTEKITVKFITAQYQKMKSGARESWEPAKEYGTIDKGVGSINKSNKSNNNNSTNNNPGGVRKATDGNKKKGRNTCKNVDTFMEKQIAKRKET